MKRAKKVLFFVLMIALIYTIEAYATTGTITTEGARIREEADTSAEVVTVVYEGENVEIIEKDGSWYKVEYDGNTGYIREDLLEADGEVKEAAKAKEVKEEPEKQEEVKAEETKQEEKPETQSETKKEEKKSNPLGEKQVTQANSVRILPSLSSSIIGEVKEGDKVTVIKVINSWSCIKFNDGKKAWIPTRFLKDVEEVEQAVEKPADIPVAVTTEQVQVEEPTTRTGYVNVSAAVVREEPSTSAEPLAEVYMNKAVEIIGEDDSWYKILYNGEEAYIAKRLVSDSPNQEASRGGEANRPVPEVSQVEENQTETVHGTVQNNAETNNQPVQETQSEVAVEPKVEAKKETVAEAPKEASAPAVASSKGEEVVATAKQYLGCSYVYGGSGPSSFDCSGFTMYIFGKFGVSLAHGAVSQSNAGTYVSKENLQPGDLVIFRDWDNTEIGHCGIYIGGGMFIHAANPNRGVVTDTLNSGYYYERYVTGRRLV